MLTVRSLTDTIQSDHCDTTLTPLDSQAYPSQLVIKASMAANTSPSSVTASTTSASPLLAQLPAELRNRIHRLVLHADDEIETIPTCLKCRMALLQTCKQVREEAIGIYF